MKKKILIIAVLVLVVALFVGCAKDNNSYNDVNVITNGDFEASSFADGWTTYTSSGDSVTVTSGSSGNQGSDDYKSTTDANGKSIVTMDTGNYTTYYYYSQAVDVEPDSYYELSVQVNLSSTLTITGSLGAYIGIAENTAVVKSITEKTEGFVTLKTYFKNDNYNSINVRVGLGNENNNVNGSASFDNVSLKRIEEAPVGVTVFTLTNSNVTGYNNSTKDTIYLVLTAVLIVLAFYGLFILIRRNLKKISPPVDGELVQTVAPTQDKKGFAKTTITMLILLVITFVVRLVLINLVYGDMTSINYYSNMANKLAENGPVDYYLNYCADTVPTVAPGMMYVLWIFGLIGNALGLTVGSQGLAVFLKIPAIIADLIAVFVIYNVALNQNSKRNNIYSASAYALAYGLLPVVFSASSIWCSAYSVGALFILLTFIAILNKQYIKMTIWYFLAVMFMCESLILCPLLLAFAVYMYIKDETSRNILPICAVSAFIGGYLVTLPFALKFFSIGKPFIVLENCCKAFLTSNLFIDGAFNIYGLFGLAGETINTAAIICSAILVAIFLVIGILIYFRRRNRLDLMLIAAAMFVLVYTFSARMSIWFLFPALILMLVYAIYTNELRVLGCFFGFGILATVNSSYNLFINGAITGGINLSSYVSMNANDPVLIIFSILSVLFTGYFAYVTYSCTNGYKREINPIDVPYCTYVKSLFEKKDQDADNNIVEEEK